MVQCPSNDIAIAIGLMVKPGIELLEFQADALFRLEVFTRWVAPVGRQHGVQCE